MTTERTVSCVIPTHNRAEYLVEALGSIGTQSVRPLEVVVVSDMNDPKAQRACDEFTASTGIPIRYAEYPDEVGGASASRNNGVSLSSGSFIAFLDDDDTWNDEYLATSLATLDRSAAELSVAWIVMFMGDRVKPGPAIAPGLSAEQVVAVNPGATGSNMVITKEAFKALGGFDVELRMKNDTDFFYRFVKSGRRYAVVEERLVNQRKHDSGQLTGHSAARAQHTRLYMSKHRSDLARTDRRQLRFVIHRIQSHSSPSAAGRIWHRALALMNYSPAQYSLDRANRTDSAFFAVPSISADRTTGRA